MIGHIPLWTCVDMSTINPMLVKFLDECGVPPGEIDGALVTVGKVVFSATITNLVAPSRMQMSKPINIPKLQRRLGAVKSKGNSVTILFAIPKGSATVQKTKNTNISVNISGAEDKWAAVLHAHMFALALCKDGNLTIPTKINILHCGISINPKNLEGTSDVQNLYDTYRTKVETQFENSEIPGCQMYIGASKKSKASTTVFSTQRAISTGIPANEVNSYLILIARIIYHMIMLTSGTPQITKKRQLDDDGGEGSSNKRTKTLTM